MSVQISELLATARPAPTDAEDAASFRWLCEHAFVNLQAWTDFYRAAHEHGSVRAAIAHRMAEQRAQSKPRDGSSCRYPLCDCQVNLHTMHGCQADAQPGMCE